MLGRPVKIVKRHPRLGAILHAFAIIFAVGLLSGTILSLAPVLDALWKDQNFLAIAYILLLLGLVGSYWPAAVYRSLVLACRFLPKSIYVTVVPALDPLDYPPVAAIIAVRNESYLTVKGTIDSLLSLKYPGLEIIVSDNSDLVTDQGTPNLDALYMLYYALGLESRVKVIRRDTGPFFHDDVRSSGPVPHIMRLYGDRRGGKAGNLNAAMPFISIRVPWVLVLDADSCIDLEALHNLVSVAVFAEKLGKRVGFVQTGLVSTNDGSTSVASAISALEDLYHAKYYPVKASFGSVANWGHGVLISSRACEDTGGFPDEITEDLAWANALHIQGGYDNFHLYTKSGEEKPQSWDALRIQRARWAEGTSRLIFKQGARILRSSGVRFSEKCDVFYDMLRYVFIAFGCVLPFLFCFSFILGEHRDRVTESLIWIFFAVLVVDNLLMPLEALCLFFRGRFCEAGRMVCRGLVAAVYMGGVSSEIFRAVFRSLKKSGGPFEVTPKSGTPSRQVDSDVRWGILRRNKLSMSFGALGIVLIAFALGDRLAVVIFLLPGPICYFLSPFLHLLVAAERVPLLAEKRQVVRCK